MSWWLVVLDASVCGASRLRTGTAHLDTNVRHTYRRPDLQRAFVRDVQVQPLQPPWLAAFQQQQQQQQQQLAPPPPQMASPADALGASMPAWWQQLAQQGQQAQPQMQQVTLSLRCPCLMSLLMAPAQCSCMVSCVISVIALLWRLVRCL